jgi:hypothetical protein
VKDLTASDLLVLSDLSDSSYVSDNSTSKPELVQDQPTVAAAAGNLINPDAWTPIATPRAPIPEEFCIPPQRGNSQFANPLGFVLPNLRLRTPKSEPRRKKIRRNHKVPFSSDYL